MATVRTLLQIFISILLAASATAQPVKQLETWLARNAADRNPLSEQKFANATLSQKEAAHAAAVLMEDANKRLRIALQQQWLSKVFIHNTDTLRIEYRVFGEKPADG